MASEDSTAKVVELLEGIAARLENIDKKLSAIQADTDMVARNTSPLQEESALSRPSASTRSEP